MLQIYPYEYYYKFDFVWDEKVPGFFIFFIFIVLAYYSQLEISCMNTNPVWIMILGNLTCNTT